MSTLFLHIGTSKTGSTSLQNYLSNNKDKLLNDNYYVYSNEDSGNFSSLAYIFSETHVIYEVLEYSLVSIIIFVSITPFLFNRRKCPHILLLL